MDISKNKLVKSYIRRRGDDYEREHLREKLNLFQYQPKTMQ